jgi:hypothetical protein
MSLTIHVQGIPEAIEAFRDLPRQVRNRHMRIAMNAGGGVIRNAMAARMPVETGLLKRSLRVKVKVPDASFNVAHHGRPAYAVIGPKRGITGRVGISRKGVMKTLTTRQAIRASFGGSGFHVRRPSRYAHLIERGTKAYMVSVKDKRVLSNGQTIFGRSVLHPGIVARRPMAGAVASSGAAAQAKVIHKLRDGIFDWAAKRAGVAKRQLTGVM